jgi:hypothetical protein
MCTGCVENELGLRQFLEERGHEYIVTDSKEGPGNDLDKYLPDTDIVSSLPRSKHTHICTHHNGQNHQSSTLSDYND